MPTVLLVRHGRTEANASRVLAGRTPGVHLDDTGRSQAKDLASRLAGVPLAAVVSSPLERCLETAEALVADRAHPTVTTENRLVECGYGEWTGRPVRELSRTRLWRQVQIHPAAAVFPGGESMRAVQARAVDAVREHDARVAERAGGRAVWAAVSHADVIKAIVADALGMHLDLFQRLVIDPGSVTVISFTELRPYVVRLNDTSGTFSGLARRRGRRRPSGDGVVGGGPGTE